MLEINSRNIRTWSMLGQRGAIFTIALPEIAKTDKSVIAMTADLGVLSGLERFKNAFPEQYFDMGIAEQNMIGVAYGLAREGNCVFATTYATFLTMRCFEQIRNNLGLMKGNVKLVGASSGFAMETSGNCHHSLEDIALMRVIPNMTVICPADSLEAVKAIQAAYLLEGPVYIRLTGGINCPVVYKEDFNFEIGKVNLLKKGKDIAILATGTVVNEALKAAEILKESDISPTVIDVHTLKPLDKELKHVFKTHKLIITVEEHSIIGGLGSAIAELASVERYENRHICIGIRDEFPPLGEYNYLLEACGLNSGKIAEVVLRNIT